MVILLLHFTFQKILKLEMRMSFCIMRRMMKSRLTMRRKMMTIHKSYATPITYHVKMKPHTMSKVTLMMKMRLSLKFYGLFWTIQISNSSKSPYLKHNNNSNILNWCMNRCFKNLNNLVLSRWAVLKRVIIFILIQYWEYLLWMV